MDGDAVAGGATAQLPLEHGAGCLISYESGDELVAAQDRDTRRKEWHATIAVRGSVNWIDDDREIAAAGRSRLFTDHPKASTAQNPARNLVGGDVQVVLRGAIARKATAAMVLHRFANLVRALTKWKKERVGHAATVAVSGASLSVNGRY